MKFEKSLLHAEVFFEFYRREINVVHEKKSKSTINVITIMFMHLGALNFHLNRVTNNNICIVIVDSFKKTIKIWDYWSLL